MVWDLLLDNAAIKAWAIASLVVALKTLASGVYTSAIRIRKGVFASPEDYRSQGLEPKSGVDDDVDRSRRIHLNDLEAGVPFALVGFIYALTQPSTLGVWICFAGFPIGRILHMITYARGMMPARTIAWSIGFVITVWMAVSSLYSLL